MYILNVNNVLFKCYVVDMSIMKNCSNGLIHLLTK